MPTTIKELPMVCTSPALNLGDGIHIIGQTTPSGRRLHAGQKPE
jgi:hypothetical protein